MSESSPERIKARIQSYALDMGVDDVGFCSLRDYQSPRSPKVEDFFPKARSMVVLAYKELNSCESINLQVAMNGRLDLMEFSRSCNYKLARFIEKEYGASTMTVPVSYPINMSTATGGAIGEVSLRHAAAAAGLGNFGRNNLVLHPKFGSRVIFTAVISTLDVPSDPVITDDICTKCDICIESCPAGALDEEGRTHVMKCLRNSQPYGLGGLIGFWSTFAGKTPEEQKKMVQSEQFWRLYQASFIGFQYHCFNCMSTCPL